MPWGRSARAWFGRVIQLVRESWHQHPKEFAAAAFAMICALVALVIAQALLLRMVGWGINFGSFPDWLAAIGTVGAFWVAGLVWRHDVRGRRADEGARAAASKRAQADLVAAWIVVRTPSAVVIGLSNASKGLAYDVQIQTRAKPTTLAAAVAPSMWMMTGQATMARGQLSVLPPGQGMVSLNFSAQEDMDVATLELWFRDQAANIWYRDERGRLFPVSERKFSLVDPFSNLAMNATGMREILSANPFHVEPQILALVNNGSFGESSTGMV